MAKSYDQRMKEYRNMCVNHAQLEAVYMKFEIASDRPDAAGVMAARAARWAFQAYPELRETV